MSIRFDGIENNLTMTSQQIERFSLCKDEEERLLDLKHLAQKLVPIYDANACYYDRRDHQPMEPTDGMKAREYAQIYVLKHPGLFSFFGKLFPNLSKTSEEMLDLYMNDGIDLALLEEQLASLFKLLLGTKDRFDDKEFDLFIKKIEITFAASEEKRRLAYRALAKTCDLLDCLYCSRGRTKCFLKNSILTYGDGNELLSIEVLRILINKKDPHQNISKDIKKYCIKKDKKFLIEVAKNEAVRSVWDLTAYISDYGIEDQDALVEIAKIAAAQENWITSTYIASFGIKEEKRRVEVAKIAFVNCNENIINALSNYNIRNTTDLLTLFLISLESSPSTVSSYVYKFKFGCIVKQLGDIRLPILSSHFLRKLHTAVSFLEQYDISNNHRSFC